MKDMHRKCARVAASALLWTGAAMLHPALASDAPSAQGEAQSAALPMQRYRDYSRELCLDLPAGATVSYRLQTPYPLDFDFHHHHDAGTSYLVQHQVATSDADVIPIAEAGHYCFRLKNTMEPPADFSAQLEYRVL